MYSSVQVYYSVVQCVKHALDGSRRTWCRYDDKQSWHIKHFGTLHKCCLYCFRIIFLFFHFFIQLRFGLLPTSWFSCFFQTFNSSWLLTWWANNTTTQQVTVCSVANIGLKTPIVCHDYASSRPLYPTLKISYRYVPTSQCQKGRTRGSRLTQKLIWSKHSGRRCFATVKDVISFWNVVSI